MSKERNLRRRLAYHLRKRMRAVAGVPIPFDGCALFQCDVHLDATGDDPAEKWRGRYTTPRGMRRVMGKGGLANCMRGAARRHGWKRIKPSAAKVGDVGLVLTPTGFAVVRMLHRGEWIGRNAMGWSMLPTNLVRVAWAVC